MAMYPDRDDTKMMTEPGSFSPGKNGEVVRIVMHQTWAYQSIIDQASINVRQWTQDTHAARAANPNSLFGVSAHFTVEASGRIIQHVDTADVAKGTGAFTGGGITIPALSVRRAETTVELPSGGSLVIGGLMQNQSKQSIDGFPGLKDLPILGALFRSRDFQNNETELVVMVTAYLVDPVSEARLARPDQGFVALLTMVGRMDVGDAGRVQTAVACQDDI